MNYTADERAIKQRHANFASAVLHGLAAIASAAGMVALLWGCRFENDGRMVFSIVVYGGSLMLALGSSAAYHGTRRWTKNWIFATFDHCAIFLLIAGTYTPFGLIALHDRGGTSLVATEWALAFTGIVTRLFWIRRLHQLSIPIYLMMGWLGLAWSRAFVGTIGATGISLILIGGAAYTLGVLAYRWQSFAFHNPVWHIFVITGAASHFWAIASVLSNAGRSAGMR